MDSVTNAIKASFILIACLCIHPTFAQVEHVVKLGTGIMSLEAVDSYPQKLLEVIENSDTAVIVKISTFNEWEDVQAVKKNRDALECGCYSLKSYRFRNGRLIEEQTVKYQF